MLDVDATQIKKHAEAIRRRTRDVDVIGLCDLILNARAGEQVECPRCVERRRLKAQAMQRYRKKSGAGDMGDFE